MSYLIAFPIIDSGLKYAHSMRTLFVSFEQDVLLSPITPAKLITFSFDIKTQFFPDSSISVSSKVWNLSSILRFLKLIKPPIFEKS